MQDHAERARADRRPDQERAGVASSVVDLTYPVARLLCRMLGATGTTDPREPDTDRGPAGSARWRSTLGAPPDVGSITSVFPRKQRPGQTTNGKQNLARYAGNARSDSARNGVQNSKSQFGSNQKIARPGRSQNSRSLSASAAPLNPGKMVAALTPST